MSHSGETDLMVQARSALLDALEALAEHADSVVVIGAQAIYLHTGRVDVALAEATKDSDLAIDTRSLADDPLIEEAMRLGDFLPNPISRQPGAWINAQGIPVDLMVPESISGSGGSRGGRIPPHSKSATRRARGIEAAVVDNAPREIQSLDQRDTRVAHANVAGPAALLVAKLHKLGEREGDPDRLVDKDAHDVYRLLMAIETRPLADRLEYLLEHELSREVTREALAYLSNLFADGPEALGSLMAGRAELGLGDPEVVSAACAALAGDLLEAADGGKSMPGPVGH